MLTTLKLALAFMCAVKLASASLEPRDIMDYAWLSSNVYDDYNQGVIITVPTTSRQFRITYVLENVHAYAWLVEEVNSDECIFVVRGSSGLPFVSLDGTFDWFLHNFDTDPVSLDGQKIGGVMPWVYKGWWTHAKLLMSGHRVQHVKDWIASCDAAGANYSFTGHSLGGAVAQLLAMSLDANWNHPGLNGFPSFRNVHRMVTFGAPKVIVPMDKVVGWTPDWRQFVSDSYKCAGVFSETDRAVRVVNYMHGGADAVVYWPFGGLITEYYCSNSLKIEANGNWAYEDNRFPRKGVQITSTLNIGNTHSHDAYWKNIVASAVKGSAARWPSVTRSADLKQCSLNYCNEMHQGICGDRPCTSDDQAAYCLHGTNYPWESRGGGPWVCMAELGSKRKCADEGQRCDCVGTVYYGPKGAVSLSDMRKSPHLAVSVMSPAPQICSHNKPWWCNLVEFSPGSCQWEIRPLRLETDPAPGILKECWCDATTYEFVDAGFDFTTQTCQNNGLDVITNAADCEAAALERGIPFNTCCQNISNGPAGCFNRVSDSDVIWNGNFQSTGTSNANRRMLCGIPCFISRKDVLVPSGGVAQAACLSSSEVGLHASCDSHGDFDFTVITDVTMPALLHFDTTTVHVGACRTASGASSGPNGYTKHAGTSTKDCELACSLDDNCGAWEYISGNTQCEIHHGFDIVKANGSTNAQCGIKDSGAFSGRNWLYNWGAMGQDDFHFLIGSDNKGQIGVWAGGLGSQIQDIDFTPYLNQRIQVMTTYRHSDRLMTVYIDGSEVKKQNLGGLAFGIEAANFHLGEAPSKLGFEGTIHCAEVYEQYYAEKFIHDGRRLAAASSSAQ